MQEKLTGQEIEENRVINYWINKSIEARKELEQYKKSKQAIKSEVWKYE